MTTYPSTALTDHQAIAYLTLASRPDTNSMGGPSMRQLRVIGKMPRDDRAAVLSEFAAAVESNLAPNVRAEINRQVALAVWADK